MSPHRSAVLPLLHVPFRPLPLISQLPGFLPRGSKPRGSSAPAPRWPHSFWGHRAGSGGHLNTWCQRHRRREGSATRHSALGDGAAPGRAPRWGGTHSLGTSAALISSSSASRALWSGPFIKLVNISAEFVSPPKVNICAEFNFNLTSSCLQRLPCLCVRVCVVCVCFPCVLPRGSMLAGRRARDVRACVHPLTAPGEAAGWGRAARGAELTGTVGTGAVARAINASHRPLLEVAAGKMCPVWLWGRQQMGTVASQPVLPGAAGLVQLGSRTAPGLPLAVPS